MPTFGNSIYQIRSLLRVALSPCICLGLFTACNSSNGSNKPSHQDLFKTLHTSELSDGYLVELYKPYSFSEKVIHEKLKAAKDPLQFFRSFLPVYYDLAKQNQPLTGLEPFRGVIGGDAHFENFGTLINNNGDVYYSLNDLDDAALKAPLYLDLIRLLVSARLSDYKADFGFRKITLSYLDGLEGAEEIVPLRVRELLVESAAKGLKARNKYFSGSLFNPPDKSEPLDTQTQNAFFQALTPVIEHSSLLKDTNSPIRLIESTAGEGQSVFRFISYDGGAGGLERVEIPVEVGSSKIAMVFEAKELRYYSSYPVDLDLRNHSEADRMMSAEKILRGNNKSDLSNIIRVGEKTYYVRPKFSAEKNLEFDKLAKRERQDVVQYEAYLLGKLHAEQLAKTGQLDDYINAFKALDPKDDIGEVAKSFEAIIRELFIRFAP